MANEKSFDLLAGQIGPLVHELRNVFSAVRGFATVIGEELRPGDPAREDVAQILKAVDHGTEVTVRLAALQPHVAADPRPAPRVRRPATILVVEDDDLVRNMTVRVLRRSGYATLDGASAEQAEELARGQALAIDLLLADVGLPASGGPELATRLRQRFPALKVLFMSGLGREAIVERGLSAGVELLEKPFLPNALLERIDTLLR